MSYKDFKDAMPKKTYELLTLIAEGDELKDFTLVGGTGLAMQLKHRTSEDLDFFIHKNKLDNNIFYELDKLFKRVDHRYPVSELVNIDADMDMCRDYKFKDIKVTFLATPLSFLRKPTNILGINVADVEQITAMKVYTVLKHRTKSRDFYDLKYIMNEKGYSVEDIIDIAKKYYPALPFSEQMIEFRFLRKDLNINDEGFQNLILKKEESFTDIRTFFKNEFKKISDKLNYFLNSDIAYISENLCKPLGLLRKSPITVLYENSMKEKIYKLNLVEKKESLLIKDIHNRTVFDIISDDVELLDHILYQIDFIPDLSRANRNDNKVKKIIDKHKIINRCLDKSVEQIEKIIHNKNVDYENFHKALIKKRDILQNNNADLTEKKRANYLYPKDEIQKNKKEIDNGGVSR